MTADRQNKQPLSWPQGPCGCQCLACATGRACRAPAEAWRTKGGTVHLAVHTTPQSFGRLSRQVARYIHSRLFGECNERCRRRAWCTRRPGEVCTASAARPGSHGIVGSHRGGVLPWFADSPLYVLIKLELLILIILRSCTYSSLQIVLVRSESQIHGSEGQISAW